MADPEWVARQPSDKIRPPRMWLTLDMMAPTSRTQSTYYRKAQKAPRFIASETLLKMGKKFSHRITTTLQHIRVQDACVKMFGAVNQCRCLPGNLSTSQGDRFEVVPGSLGTLALIMISVIHHLRHED